MKIFVISRSVIFRTGLSRIFSETVTGTTVSEADSVSHLSTAKGTEGPAEYLFVIGYPDHENDDQFISHLSSLRNRFPGSRIILIEEMLPAGLRNELPRLFRGLIQGYLAFDSDLSVLKTCIRTVMEGKVYLSQELLQILFESHWGEKVPGVKRKKKLTENELKIAFLLSEGHRVSDIARTTGRKISTISTLKKNIFKKTDTQNVIKLRDFLRIHNPGGLSESLRARTVS